METQTLACNNNWLDIGTVTGGSLQTSLTTTNSGSCGTGYYQTGYYQTGYWYPYYQVISSPARPIKLTLSEIERLRKAAKGDKSLKAILAKFTDQIEITVDFE